MKTTLMVMALVLSGCSVREYVIDRTVAEQVHYVPDVEHYGGHELKQLTERVYTWRWTWDRNIVVKTSEGFVVVDPFNAESARLLKAELAKIAPGVPVHTLFYSHYHLDHVPGGAGLEPQHVVAHAKCPKYWSELSDDPLTRQILPPTELIEGDQKRVIGGVEIDLIELGHSHTDTLYAYYLPAEKLLFTVDTGLVKTFFPMGGPDMYFPGIFQAMDKLAQLDFDVWVPSHFGIGHKSDFLASLAFLRDVRRLAIETREKYGLPDDSETFVKSFHHVYDQLKAKYGDYHGFDEQALFVVARAYSGAFLGY
jgi:glyoxylase-like metal-dependent hydrolase (beta-lactamase superfamily II)